MNAKLLGAAAMFLCASVASAQPAGAATKISQGLAARTSATDSIKTGNGQAAIAQLRGAAKQGSAAKSQDFQVVGELCSIARTLTVERHASARDTVLLAASELTRAKPTLTRTDAALLDAQIGELYETCLGDGTAARQYYNSALALDSTRKDAAEGLRRLNRLAALLQAKAQENNTLRARGK